MNQLLKNFISLGNTGNICYLQPTLKDLDIKDDSVFQKQIQDFTLKKINKIILVSSPNKDNPYKTFSDKFVNHGIQCSLYNPVSEIKEQVELFETILDSQKPGNISILYDENFSSAIELTIKIVLYINPSLSIEEVYSYFLNAELDIVTLNEFKEYTFFLENDPYILTKPDRKEFNKDKPQPKPLVNGAKSILPSEELKSNTAFTLNLSSLKNASVEEETLLTETQKIKFNLNSLIESDFEKEESPEEHYEKLKHTAHQEVDDSLSLDVDLSEEIEYISSLENLSAPTKEKISIVDIQTVPLDSEFESTKIPNPTIDYKNKQYIDFDAIIDEEIEQGMMSEELGIDLTNENLLTPSKMNLDEFIAEDKEEMFSFEDHLVHLDADSAINLDVMDTKANIDLSFPTPLPDLEDLLEEEMELETEVTGGHESLVDPSQTFMVKRINDVIKKEVLNDDSKGKIPVSDLTKVDTNTTEAVTQKSSPTLPKVSNPKISSPKFNPITLDD